MNLYTNISIIITLAVFISYLNHRFLKIQPVIATTLTSLALAIPLLFLDRLGWNALDKDIVSFVNSLHFDDVLMDSMLGLMLFAGAFTIDLPMLKKQKWEVLALSSLSVVASTVLIGFSMHFLLHALGSSIRLIYCFLFGALISPTDPIVVLSIFKKSNAPKRLQMLMSAESLFNDGIAVVMFVSLYTVAFLHGQATFKFVFGLFLKNTIGGIVYGYLLSYFILKLMRSVSDQKIEILLTIALVTGGYTLAETIDVSGPLAMAVAGIAIANYKRKALTSKATRQYLESFWELIDELLNAILFLLIGVEILLVHFTPRVFITTACVIPLVLLARFITVALPLSIKKIKQAYPPLTLAILTWGGLRGGLAVALALAIQNQEVRDTLLPMTYLVVLFSILVQGNTIQILLKWSAERTKKNTKQSNKI